MAAHEANNPFDLLGQTPSWAPAVELRGDTEPALRIGWGDFHAGFWSNLAELFHFVRVPKDFLTNSYFRDAWIENKIPRRALLAAALWHLAVVLFPFPQFSAPRRNHAFDNQQLVWSGPVEDFPLIDLPAAKAKPSPRGKPNQPPAPEGADAFHPRQRIFTDPTRPNHPRQTLINPKAPDVAPQFLPDLPNVVQLAQSDAPARPKLEISQAALKKLRPPKQKRIAADPNAPAPEMQATQQASDVPLLATTSGPEKPKLEINAASAPRVAARKQDGAAEPAPDVANGQLTSPNGGAQTLIALSATPGPPAPMAPPNGNLAARVTISPEGTKPGVPGGTANASGAGNAGGDHPGGAAGAGGAGNSTGVSITGGSPKSASTISGVGSGKLALPSSKPSYSRAEMSKADEPPPVRTAPPNFSTLAPDAKPEAIFARRRVYSLNVNMPNLNSATGSWILNFAELRSPTANPLAAATGEIAEPSPVRKVDPKYPPTLAAEHVEGEVILYAVIRRDGSVDSIQVVKGIDEQLDANAVRALAQWKFRPAERNGEPLDLEAIVHIPFRAPRE
ncbi:MAG TPA: TonB family protein [Dongiaceae bacterium]|nr:TonB family protein [Dongiaceae bacterium]